MKISIPYIGDTRHKCLIVFQKEQKICRLTFVLFYSFLQNDNFSRTWHLLFSGDIQILVFNILQSTHQRRLSIKPSAGAYQWSLKMKGMSMSNKRCWSNKNESGNQFTFVHNTRIHPVTITLFAIQLFVFFQHLIYVLVRNILLCFHDFDKSFLWYLPSVLKIEWSRWERVCRGAYKQTEKNKHSWNCISCLPENVQETLFIWLFSPLHGDQCQIFIKRNRKPISVRRHLLYESLGLEVLFNDQDNVI